MSRDIDELIDSPYADEVLGDDDKKDKDKGSGTWDKIQTVLNSKAAGSLLDKIPGGNQANPTPPNPATTPSAPSKPKAKSKDEEAQTTGAIVGVAAGLVLGFLAWKFTKPKHRMIYTVLGAGVGAGAGVVTYMAKKG